MKYIARGRGMRRAAVEIHSKGKGDEEGSC